MTPERWEEAAAALAAADPRAARIYARLRLGNETGRAQFLTLAVGYVRASLPWLRWPGTARRQVAAVLAAVGVWTWSDEAPPVPPAVLDAIHEGRWEAWPWAPAVFQALVSVGLVGSPGD